MEICKLCLENKKLQKKSHIIPDFMYKELYDEKHRLYKIYNEEIEAGNLKKRMVNDAAYEKNILCHDCDNDVINRRYENYANLVFYSNNTIRNDRPNFKKCIN